MYKVSNYGKVRSLHTGKLKKLCHGKIFLCRKDIQSSKSLERIVAEAFLPNPQKKHFVLKLKGNSCRAENLYWSNCSYKLKQPKSENHYNRKLNSSEVTEIVELSQFVSSSELSKAYNISTSTVFFIKTGQRWSSQTKVRYTKKWSQKNGRKLTKNKAENIRKSYGKGTSQNKLAKKYGVSQPVIFDIVHGRTHV